MSVLAVNSHAKGEKKVVEAKHFGRELIAKFRPSHAKIAAQECTPHFSSHHNGVTRAMNTRPDTTAAEQHICYTLQT